MTEKLTLGQILDILREMGKDLEEVMDYSAVKPNEHQHRTAVFVRLPYPKVVGQYEEVQERLHRFLTSLNRPDTIKCDIYTIVGKEIMEGYQPHTGVEAKGDVEPDALHRILDKPYVLQVVVDVVHPNAMATTYEHLT